VARVTTTSIKEKKQKGEKITMLTVYDYTMAKILDEVGIDILLVGDSLGMVMLGYENTLPVTIEDINYHTLAVSRGAKNALIVGDMPFMSYEVEISEAIRNGGMLIKEGGAHAVKVEGGREITQTIRAMLRAKIPVMGHIGLTPQAIHRMGGYRIRGRDSVEAKRILEDAKELEEVGVFAVVLECIPYLLAKEITETIKVPTIGIGAGPYCDGQVLVLHDLLGLYEEMRPKFVRRYKDLAKEIRDGVKGFIEDVKEGRFPTLEESYE
jgi:3-methyl-2-oxobutanoate hydroxymethyltransferase